MSSDPAVSGKDAIRALEHFGVRLDRIEGSHHMLIRDGHPYTVVVPVHGSKPLPKRLWQASSASPVSARRSSSRRLGEAIVMLTNDPGYAIQQDCLTEFECDEIIKALSLVARSRAGARHLMANPMVAELSLDHRLARIARKFYLQLPGELCTNRWSLSSPLRSRRNLQNGVRVPPQKRHPSEPVFGVDPPPHRCEFLRRQDARGGRELRPGDLAPYRARRDRDLGIIPDALIFPQLAARHEVQPAVFFREPDGRAHGNTAFSERCQTQILLAVNLGWDAVRHTVNG